MNAPYRPPQINAAWSAVAVWNAIISHSGTAVPLTHAKGASVSFAAAAPPAQTADTLELRTGTGAEILCVVQSFPFKRLFGAEFDMADVPELPAPLQQMLYEGVVASLVPAIPGNSLGGVELRSTGPFSRLAPAQGAPLHWLSATLTGICPEPVALLLGGQIGQFAALFQLSPPALRNWPALRQGLALPAWFCLGQMIFSFSQLQALGPGDVIVLAAGDLTRCTLRVAGAAYAIQMDAAGVTCTGVKRQLSQRPHSTDLLEKPSMDIPSETAASVPLAMASLPLQIDFDIGQVEVPLAEVETWQAGSFIKLAPPVLADGVEVTLRCNNQVIAIGDLVRIDERLAVRLTRLIMVTQG